MADTKETTAESVNSTIMSAREGIALRGESMWSIYVRRFRKHTLGKIGLGLLLLFYLGALFADFLSPFDMTWTDKRKSYHPPTNLYFLYDGPDGREFKPWVYEQRLVNPTNKQYGVIPPRAMRLISIEAMPGVRQLMALSTAQSASERLDELSEEAQLHYSLSPDGEVIQRLTDAMTRIERDPDPDARMRLRVGTRQTPSGEVPLEVWIVKGNRNFFSLFAEATPYRFLGLFTARRHLITSPTGGFFILGTDVLGRDMVSRLIHGSRVSLTIGLVGSAISFVLGLLIGGMSGYFGGRFDNIVQRTSEVIIAIPGLYLILALRATFPQGLSSVQVFFLIVAIFALIGWTGLARTIRGLILSIKSEDYVMSARTMGLSHLRVITRHVLPNTMSYVIVSLTLQIPGYILGESALSLLGLGITEPQSSWGLMLSAARNTQVVMSFPWILIPGVLIFLAILAWNFFGDGIRDAVDPKSKH